MQQVLCGYVHCRVKQDASIFIAVAENGELDIAARLLARLVGKEYRPQEYVCTSIVVLYDRSRRLCACHSVDVRSQFVL